MQALILGTVVPLLHQVGELWIGGKLQIFQEHFLSEPLIRFLNAEISALQKGAGKPRVVLATLPGEEHTLDCSCWLPCCHHAGVSVINLGAEVPMEQIGRAVQQFHSEVVGITFSGSYQYNNIRQHLLELRELLADEVDIWTGGEGVRRLRKLPAGVTRFNSLEKLALSAADRGQTHESRKETVR